MRYEDADLTATTNQKIHGVKFTDGERTEFMAQIWDPGVSFPYGPGWGPSEVFAHLRDRGDLSGTFRKVTLRARNRIVITDE